jgi:hypothetical protein
MHRLPFEDSLLVVYGPPLLDGEGVNLRPGVAKDPEHVLNQGMCGIERDFEKAPTSGKMEP